MPRRVSSARSGPPARASRSTSPASMWRALRARGHRLTSSKIDAEGEEERIIAGGRAFFAEHSPLVMFEIKAGDKVNERLLELFPAIGYRLFRLIPGAPILVPQDASQPLDGYELNLFAAKSDRVSALSKQQLLVETIPAWAPGDVDRKNALVFWRRQTFASPSTVSCPDGISADSDYQDSLAAYATWRSLDQPITTRCAALAFALQTLRSVCARACTAERASTWARVAWEWGARSESVAALRQLFQMLQSTRIPLSEPFWPASSRFDDHCPGKSAGGLVRCGGGRAIRANLRFLVRLQRRLFGSSLAMQPKARQCGNGTPARPHCGSCGPTTDSAGTALHRRAGQSERGHLARRHGSGHGAWGVMRLHGACLRWFNSSGQAKLAWRP